MLPRAVAQLCCISARRTTSRSQICSWSSPRTIPRSRLRRSTRSPDLRFRHELEGNRVHAVSRVLRGQPLADEDVAEVPATGGAFDLDTTAIWVRQPAHGTLDLLIERWPAATRVELCI